VRKRWIAAMVVAAAAVGGLWLGQRPLGEALYTRMAEARAGGDAVAGLPDGLHLFLCGTGSPLPDPARAGPCAAVIAGDRLYVIDVGEGASRTLARAQFPLGQLDGLFLTHLHSDHIDGLGELLLQAWVAGGREAPLPVYGPAGTDKVVGGLRTAYEIDEGYRIAHHGPKVVHPTGFGGSTQIIALPDGTDTLVAYDQGGVKITAIRVNHAPINPAFGYRIDYKGRAITISGDTVYSPSFTAASKGADLMLHEALNKDMIAALGAKLAERGQAANAQIMNDIQNYHASPEDAARSAKEAGVKALVLYHLVPAPPVRLIEPMFLGNAPKVFAGTLRLANDGMLIHLPAGSSDVEITSAF